MPPRRRGSKEADSLPWLIECISHTVGNDNRTSSMIEEPVQSILSSRGHKIGNKHTIKKHFDLTTFQYRSDTRSVEN